MAAQTHPSAPALPQRPELRVIEAPRRAAQLHLFTFVVGNAVFWTLWAAISVTADPWYWWPIVPLVGWAVVLAAHLRHVYRGSAGRRRSSVGPEIRRRASALRIVAPVDDGAGDDPPAGGKRAPEAMPDSRGAEPPATTGRH